MELNDFVQRTLQQIAQGVENAQKQLAQEGSTAKINPGKEDLRARSYEPAYVEFDVAVTASEGKEAKGVAGITVAGWGLGAQHKSDRATSAVSRVKFQVPLVLPTWEEK